MLLWKETSTKLTLSILHSSISSKLFFLTVGHQPHTLLHVDSLFILYRFIPYLVTKSIFRRVAFSYELSRLRNGKGNRLASKALSRQETADIGRHGGKKATSTKLLGSMQTGRELTVMTRSQRLYLMHHTRLFAFERTVLETDLNLIDCTETHCFDFSVFIPMGTMCWL